MVHDLRQDIRGRELYELVIVNGIHGCINYLLTTDDEEIDLIINNMTDDVGIDIYYCLDMTYNKSIYIRSKLINHLQRGHISHLWMG